MSEKNEQSAEPQLCKRCGHHQTYHHPGCHSNGGPETIFGGCTCREFVTAVEQLAASPAQLSARAWIELDEPFQAQFRKDHPHWFSTAIDDACKFAEAFRDARQRQPQSVSEEQLQKALGELSLALGNPALEFGDEGIEVALIRFAAQRLTKSAFKEEL